MAITTQTIPIELNTRGVCPTAYAHQGDTLRQLVFQVFNDGTAYDVSAYTATLAAMLPNGTGYRVIAGSNMISGTISTNTITFVLTDDYTETSGHGILTIVLTSSSNTIRPININFKIQKSADGDDVVAGASDFPATLADIVADYISNTGISGVATSATFDSSTKVITFKDSDNTAVYTVNLSDLAPEVDATLTQSGVPADAATVGDEISSLKSDLQSTDGNIGDLASLTTTDKSSIVDAINEVDGKTIETDTTLSVSGAAADAKVTGDSIADIQEALIRGDSTWSRIKNAVTFGKAATLYPVGYQFADDWYRDASTHYTSIWDVVHHYTNGDMAMCWHYAIPDGIPFDEPEAIYAFDGTESAGDYYIPVGSAYGNGWTVGLNIHVTLSEAPEEGDQLVIDCGKSNANDPTDGRTWYVYAKGDTTVKQTGTTTNEATGTSLGTIGDVNAHRTNGRLNAISRVVYGYGRWSESAIRQILNSIAAAGEWWTAQNMWDRPPAVATTLRGFLAGYSDDFLAILEEVDVVTALNTQEGFSESTETTQDRIFLPSLQEWYIATQLADVEGEDWDYNKALAEEAGLTGRFPRSTATDILKRYNIASQTSSVTVWLRSANRSYASNAWLVSTSGAVNDYYAYASNRGCPACIIKKST